MRILNCWKVIKMEEQFKLTYQAELKELKQRLKYTEELMLQLRNDMHTLMKMYKNLQEEITKIKDIELKRLDSNNRFLRRLVIKECDKDG